MAEVTHVVDVGGEAVAGVLLVLMEAGSLLLRFLFGVAE